MRGFLQTGDRSFAGRVGKGGSPNGSGPSASADDENGGSEAEAQDDERDR